MSSLRKVSAPIPPKSPSGTYQKESGEFKVICVKPSSSIPQSSITKYTDNKHGKNLKTFSARFSFFFHWRPLLQRMNCSESAVPSIVTAMQLVNGGENWWIYNLEDTEIYWYERFQNKTQFGLYKINNCISHTQLLVRKRTRRRLVMNAFYQLHVKYRDFSAMWMECGIEN